MISITESNLFIFSLLAGPIIVILLALSSSNKEKIPFWDILKTIWIACGILAFIIYMLAHLLNVIGIIHIKKSGYSSNPANYEKYDDYDDSRRR